MTDLADVVDSVFPSDGSEGVVLTDTIRITFSTEIDENSIREGGFILEGPDTDQMIHGDYAVSELSNGSEEHVLESPGYKGVVPGTLSFIRLDPVSNSPVSVIDSTGAGNLYRTQLVFMPSRPLKRITDYTVYLVGTDSLKPRTVFDPVTDPGNTGTGEIVVRGSYTGNLLQDTFYIRITKAGLSGVAEYEYWKGSAPLDVHGPILSSRNQLNLLQGVSIGFGEGLFQAGDHFSVVVKKQEAYEGIQTISFTTGSGTISAVPTTTATSPTGYPSPLPPKPFYVKKITPSAGAGNLRSHEYQMITVEFSEDIDPSTITDKTVQVIASAAISHPNLPLSLQEGSVARAVTVSGNLLFIKL